MPVFGRSVTLRSISIVCPSTMLTRKFPRDGRQQQDSLHHRKSGSDADSGTSAKGKIGKPRQRRASRIARVPSFRVEFHRGRKITRVPMHQELRHQDIRLRRQLVLAQAKGFQCPPADDPHRRIQAHSLTEHSVGVDQPRQIARRRQRGRPARYATPHSVFPRHADFAPKAATSMKGHWLWFRAPPETVS